MAEIGIRKLVLIRFKSGFGGAPTIRDLLLFPLRKKWQWEPSPVHISND